MRASKSTVSRTPYTVLWDMDSAANGHVYTGTGASYLTEVFYESASPVQAGYTCIEFTYQKTGFEPVRITMVSTNASTYCTVS